MRSAAKDGSGAVPPVALETLRYLNQVAGECGVGSAASSLGLHVLEGFLPSPA